MILIKCLKICSAGQRSISTVKGNADMKKILVLNGSPRKDSVSSALCESLVSAADEAEIKKYNAYKMNAKPCMGCGYCDKNKGCCFDDLFAGRVSAIADCDSVRVIPFCDACHCIILPFLFWGIKMPENHCFA